MIFLAFNILFVLQVEVPHVCCHISAGASSCYLQLLDKLQKRICRTVGPSLATSLEPLAHRLAKVLPICIILVGVHLTWFNWFHILILVGGVLFILIDCMILWSLFLDTTRISISTVSFFAQLDSGILYLYNTFICPMIYVALSQLKEIFQL